ncbi:MAG: GxxExxY protein [Planctomycetota bacterium]|jgi:GxxExxY protein
MEYEEITDKIIGCCYKVHNVLGHGFLESVYEKALLIELDKAGLTAKSQQDILVYYDGQIVGEFKADILIEDIIVVELKFVRMLSKAHEVQLVNYLAATQKDIGLLVNFGERSVQVKRKVRDINYYNNNPVNPV